MNLDALKNYMDEAIPANNMTGVDCIIYQNHKEIFRHTAGYGNMEEKKPIQPNSLFNIYSATKMITCVAALQLFERGKFLLDDPVHKYLPEFQNMKVKYGTYSILPAKNEIKIVDLFAMTSGLTYDRETPSFLQLKAKKGSNFNSHEFMKAHALEPLAHEPGEGWSYGFSHDVLSVLVEVISGMTFEDYLKINIFKPLGIKNASFYLSAENKRLVTPQYGYNATGEIERLTDECLGRAGDKHESGGGGLIMSAEDYILFADALACGGVGASGNRIISNRTLDLMATNRLKGKALEDYYRVGATSGNGYGLGVGVIIDSKEALTLVPNGAFTWGGIGGVQNLIDRENRLSYYVSQHLFASPKHLISRQMLTILYANL